MLERLSILIIDLSGYTALTELHGGKKAAEVVRQFEKLVQRHITYQCEIFERKGDELVITSHNPDSLVVLIKKLTDDINSRMEFPSFHAGIHFGEIYRDQNQLFGTTINLASRIQSHAESGQVLISEAFFENLSPEKKVGFKNLATVKFKNIPNQIKLYKLDQPINENGSLVDPVCRMQVNVSTKYIYNHENRDIYHFCSEECITAFKKNPAIYAR